MKKTFAALAASSAMIAAVPASAGTFYLEVGAPIGNPQQGGTLDTPKFRVVNSSPGDLLPTLSSLVLTLGGSGTVTAISSFGDGPWMGGDDDQPSLGSPSVNLGALTINYGANQFDPGVFSTFAVNFGPGSQADFRNILFGTNSSLLANFSDGTKAVVNFGTPQNATTGTFFTFNSTNVNGAVPEPATWAMMILGFALVGGVMRSSRTQARIRFA